MGSGRHPPSEVTVYSKRVAMQPRLPVHVWAMLSRGQEAESVEIEQDFITEGLAAARDGESTTVNGIGNGRGRRGHGSGSGQRTLCGV